MRARLPVGSGGATLQGTMDSETARGAPARRDQAKLVVAGVLGGLIVVFALVNLDEVEVNWLVTTAETPLIVVIAVSFLVGGAIGALALRRIGAGRRRKRPRPT
jgi:uncharacterized integral membrane protein